MNIAKVVRAWRESAEKDWSLAKDLFKQKHYGYCLFFCHLVLEKVLKALVVKHTKEPAPLIHDLRRLAEMAGLSFTEEQGERA